MSELTHEVTQQRQADTDDVVVVALDPTDEPAAQALRLMPSLRSTALTGAVQYYDAQVDDARHTMEIARTAAHYGAHVANRVAAIGFLRQGERVTRRTTLWRRTVEGWKAVYHQGTPVAHP